MTGDDFRGIVLALEGAAERAHMGHPDFRANGRIFASLTADERQAMVKVLPEEQRELLRAHHDCFRSAAGAWGRQGCTMITLARADVRAVRAAALLAWERAWSDPPPKPRPRPPAARARAARKSPR